MYKKIWLTGISLLMIFTIKAQSFTVSGVLQDQAARTPLTGATIRLTSITDSLLSLSTLSDSTGSFTFTNLGRDSFLLTISSVGYNVIRRSIRIDSTDIMMEIAAVPNASAELETVVIRTAVSPVSQKGDTLQINASQFKVNPDATAEDLARKVPGITIENGQVKAQGENVRRVTIDGRELFGEDATAALRNLPAEVIDKIQIFDRLSDQAQFSGFDDGNTSREINIVTKANMRNGQFGRVYAGYGTDNRYSLGGNATFLKENRRISLVGLSNNINQQNFSQQDLLGVTSNARSGGNNRGGGQRGANNNQGGGGQRGGNQGGGFGSNSNFLVGQQPGINRTNALGINYSDIWGKSVTVSGSYFFNNANNTTNELSNTQYFSEEVPDIIQNTRAESRNNNHRFSVRFDYRIDSSNQLLITPSLSFQDNNSERTVTTLRMRSHGDTSRLATNNTSGSRTGNNINNTILYRHSFPKRGRTFSVSLNTSFNKRDGESYVNTFERRFNSTGPEDTSTRRFSDQFNNGQQVSTNISYTEPVGRNSQLQVNYNPTFSNSNSDQQTYGFNTQQGKYSDRLDSLSNKFENRNRSQNAGLSYRYGNRDRQLSLGMSYQTTTLNSEQTFPRTLTVKKTFSNILPNAMARYKISTRSSLRFNYRANTNQPSVNQLQNVIEINNAPFYSAGNPELEQQYMHTVSSQYTYTNTGKGLLMMANIFYQAANNYITNATYIPILGDSTIGSGIILRDSSDQLTKPVNLDGYSSLRSFFTFAIPVKAVKSNLNLNGGVTFTRLPGILNIERNETRNLTLTLGTVIGSNVSQYVDFTVSYNANFNRVRSNSQANINQNYFNHVAGLQLNLLSKNGWFFQNDLNNQLYSGLTEGFNQAYTIWNMSAGKKIMKEQKGELRLSVFDLLRQNRSISREVNVNFIEDTQNEVLTQYFMLTFSYNLRNFGTAVTRGGNNPVTPR
jgi:hypothetical protein